MNQLFSICLGAISLVAEHVAGCAILADEVPGNALRVGARQGPEAAVLLCGILQGPPQPNH